ncbi:glycosyltransferase [Amphibacillus jilinensis]|uniref:glycosyltransferase n=1 Tax=Amphibacillus jilinensis TaxID=1216008 RepID=UPI0002F8C333|nr:glycosyltransferase [Amphibacillus jilinensis]
MKRIKVLFFIYQMGSGGAARTLLNIMNNLDRERFEPVLVTLDYNGSYESEVKEDIVFLKVDTQRLSRSIFKLAKIIRQQQIDVIFSTIPRVNTIAVLAKLLSFTKAKNVVREADNLDGGLIERLKLIGFGRIYKMAAQVVSLSEGVKDNLVEKYKMKRDQVKVIYNPIDIVAIEDKIKNEILEPKYIDLFKEDEKTIVTAGRLVPQKDQTTLLNAFAQVQQNIASRLIILGEGPLQPSLEILAQQLGITDRVHFLGFQRNPYLFFAKADLFVLTSKHEGFSHVIAEALATGTPVVSTNCKSGPAEVLANGEYGRLVEVGDVDNLASNMLAILTLANNELSDIISRGYQRAAFFNAPGIVRQYETVFLDVTR